jgi:TonB-dependent SusC/RagA subfamily outer membrane receptor
MKLLLPFMLLASITMAQDLTLARRSSYFTFVYKINNEEARQLYHHQKPSKKYCHTLVALFPSDSLSHQPRQPVGHYLYVKTVNHQLHFELVSNNNTVFHLLNNHRDLMFTITDTTGREMGLADVRIRNRKIKYDPQENLYRISTSNSQGILQIDYEGHTTYVKIERRYNNTFFVRTGKKIIGAFPFNHLASVIVYPVRTARNIVRGNRITPPGVYYRVKSLFQNDHSSNLRGYIVFNKPMYKPGDTLRLKAFFTHPKGTPVKKELTLRLVDYGMNPVNVALGSIQPYRPGAFTYELVLHDSLKLTLDRNPGIWVEYRNHHVTSENFRYEDYELKANYFHARAENTDKDKAAILFLKGTDSNDMPLYDVRTEVVVKPKQILDTYQDKVFIADTLWYHQGKLDPLGETRIAIPDSIFPPASLKYSATISFTNADNERHVKELTLYYDQHGASLKAEVREDSIWFFTKEHNVKVSVTALDHTNCKLYTVEKALPYSEKINPYVSKYEVRNGQTREYFRMENFKKLEVVANRTSDSLMISVNNPAQIPFRYQIFRGRKLIYRGGSSDKHLMYQSRSEKQVLYSISVQYLWAGVAQQENFNIPFDERNLQVSIDHAPLVYPGQAADFIVTVKDVKNNAVENADVTALAITKKFGNQTITEPPIYPRQQKTRLVFNEFHTKPFAGLDAEELDWMYWRKILGLDSLAFYQFIYPTNGRYTFEKLSPDSITQLAPFVVDQGKVVMPSAIYVNDRPEYYYGVQTIQPYSFRAHPGKNKVSIYLRDYVLHFWVEAKKSTKQICAIDLNTPAEGVVKRKLNTKEIEQEMEKLSRYFVWIDRDNTQKKAYIKQDDRFYVFNANYGSGRTSELVGPLYPRKTNFVVSGESEVKFDYEPFYSYQFQPGLVKQKYVAKPISRWQSYPFAFSPSFTDQIMSDHRIQELWNKTPAPPLRAFKRYPPEYTTGQNTGTLSLSIVKGKEPFFHLATFIINLDNPDKYFIYSGETKAFDLFDPAQYEVIVLRNDKSYIRSNKFWLKPFGETIVKFHTDSAHSSDAFSEKLLKTVIEWENQSTYVLQVRDKEMENVRSSYYTQSTNRDLYSGNIITGQVTSPEDGSPLPGVNVMVKGTTIGTVTDANGEYSLHAPPGVILIYSFIGFVTQEVATGNHTVHNIQLNADVQQLSEVVVVGYGVQERRSLTSSVATVSGKLAGRVAGVQAGVPGSNTQIFLRGAASLQSDEQPLIVLDGVIIDAMRYAQLSPSDITAIEILKSEAAVSIYGSRGANGVILISTRPGMSALNLRETKLPEPSPLVWEGNTPGAAIRKNFRDYAFWKPKLVTDKNGQAIFTTVFPDDITGWNVQAIATATHKKRGIGSSVVQSYKPLLAQIMGPQFLIEGDRATAIGKITNYTPDSLLLTRSITRGLQTESIHIKLKNSHIDTLQLIPANRDSLRLKYAVNYAGYEDGEIRTLPVLRKGSLEAKGLFWTLRGDTTFNIDPQPGILHIQAEADLIDVLLEEIEHVKNYAYECNEQLASKLQVLLVEKKIASYRRVKFRDNEHIRKIVRRLVNHQHEDGGWGWWGQSEGAAWITMYVINILDYARQEVTEASYDREAAIRFIQQQIFKAPWRERIEMMVFLKKNNIQTDAKELYDSLWKIKNLPVYDRLRLLSLMQEASLPHDERWIVNNKKETIKGNWYWGDEAEDLFNNDIQATLTAYAILEDKKADEKYLDRIRNFFLEKRGRHWRNTYESAKIIKALVPWLIQRGNKLEPQVEFSQGFVKTVKKFPLDTVLSASQSIFVRKTGESPVYLTAYHEFWNPTPTRSEKDFIVTTFFENDSNTLIAGKPVKLVVELEVKKDAEYVMIEIPIPAGCSYDTKHQSRRNGEVHREHFAHQTSIFCQRLRKGNYQYTISLQPRFTGTYSLNPARAEWMYFPVMFGQEAMKQILIK